MKLPMELMKEDMILLPFVNWDRFIPNEERRSVDLYGWIKREDSHEDFVLLEYCEGEEGMWEMNYSTSSAIKDKEIFQALKCKGNNSNKCIRVEDHFKINNCVRLKK